MQVRVIRLQNQRYASVVEFAFGAADAELLNPGAFMVRIAASVLVLCCTVVSATPQTPMTAPAPTTQPAKKPVAQKPKATTAAKSTPPAADSGPCRYGLLAPAGDSFTVQKLGVTVFDSDSSETPISAWGLDDVAIARLRATVGPGVRKISYSREVFAELEKPGLSRLFQDERAKIGEILRAVSSAGCAHYLVLKPLQVELVMNKQTIKGFGILKTYGGAYLFASTALQLYDGQDFHFIKQWFPDTEDRPFMSGLVQTSPIAGAQTKVERDLYPENAKDASASVALRDGVRSLLTACLDHTLPKLLAQDH